MEARVLRFASHFVERPCLPYLLMDSESRILRIRSYNKSTMIRSSLKKSSVPVPEKLLGLCLVHITPHTHPRTDIHTSPWLAVSLPVRSHARFACWKRSPPLLHSLR